MEAWRLRFFTLVERALQNQLFRCRWKWRYCTESAAIQVVAVVRGCTISAVEERWRWLRQLPRPGGLHKRFHNSRPFTITITSGNDDRGCGFGIRQIPSRVCLPWAQPKAARVFRNDVCYIETGARSPSR